jgi:hypothetical protein
MDTKIKLFQVQIVIRFEIPTILKKKKIKIKIVIHLIRPNHYPFPIVQDNLIPQ